MASVEREPRNCCEQRERDGLGDCDWAGCGQMGPAAPKRKMVDETRCWKPSDLPVLAQGHEAFAFNVAKCDPNIHVHEWATRRCSLAVNHPDFNPEWRP